MSWGNVKIEKYKIMQNLQEKRKIQMAIQEKKKITYQPNCNEKTSINENIRARFKSLLKQETLSILSNLKNYKNSNICQKCNQKIQNLNYMNYFHLHREDGERFITFHFDCALKRGTADVFNEIACDFDYVFSISDE